MEKEPKFKIGDGVTPKADPMKGIYGVVVFYNEEDQKYLVRFSEKQQLYYAEEDIKAWEQ